MPFLGAGGNTMDKSHMNRARLSIKPICEKNSNISNETEEIVKFHFSIISLWEL